MNHYRAFCRLLHRLPASLTLGLIAALLSLPLTVNAGPENGKSLHDAKCTGCHGTRIYTRANRMIHNKSELHARIEFCNKASKAGFSTAEKSDVLQYLNQDFYKFPDIQ